MLAAGAVKGLESKPVCNEFINPLTGEKHFVCSEAPSPKSQEIPQETAKPNFKVTDYQYGTYCQAMNWLNARKSLIGLGLAYDDLFDGVKKINQHSLDPLAKSVGLPDSFWLATTATYAQSAISNLRAISYRQLSGSVGKLSVALPTVKAVTTDVWNKSLYFQYALSAQLMFSGLFRGADEVIDKWGGKKLTGDKRKAFYWGTSIMEALGALVYTGVGYGTQLGGGARISNLRALGWVSWWSLYSAYFYNHVDQREYLRLQGKDPNLADYPWNWSWDAYNPNRFVSDWTSNELGGAVFWATGPKIGRIATDKIFAKWGYVNTHFKYIEKGVEKEKTAYFYEAFLPFSKDVEKRALRTDAERTFLGSSTLWKDITGLEFSRLGERMWLLAKWFGRVTKTSFVGAFPQWKWYKPFRWSYAILQSALTILIASMPLSRMSQIAREIVEDDKSRKPLNPTDPCVATGSSIIHGIGNRSILSSALNNLVLGPVRWMGVNLSIFGFYAPGMLLNVYPYNSCNEIPSSYHQLALLHLERYREASSEEDKAREKSLFQMFFGLANLEDQQKDKVKYANSSYPQEVRDLFDTSKFSDALDPAMMDVFMQGAQMAAAQLPENLPQQNSPIADGEENSGLLDLSKDPWVN